MEGDTSHLQILTADVKTNSGAWYVELHQNAPGGKYLVGGVHEAP
ncbi:hypothetical protein [Arthrobacter sp. AQ5-05]|nr:hypothetical protein [Arthrobacter sp. AQ5-05]